MDSQLQIFQSNLQKTFSHVKSEYAKLQTGRASTALVESIPVEAYGQVQQLKAIAGVSVQDARTILIQPWDKTIISSVEKALVKANLGTSPVNDGAQIRIILPQMTEERRWDLVKIVKELAEEARITVRKLRQEVHTNSKKDATRTEDQHRMFEADVQKAVDAMNKDIESLAKKKEEEIMKI